MKHSDILPIGFIAKRTGLSVSAIRFYEDKGLITPHRNASGHRRYMRSDIRRLSFILIMQQLGFRIEDIKQSMSALPNGRTPTKADWKQISEDCMTVLEDRIAAMQRMKNSLNGCIGCGCLSLSNCELYNPNDRLNARGNGAQMISPSPEDPK